MKPTIRITLHITRFLVPLLLLSISVFFSACSGDEETATPKPRAYFRISFPEKKYIKYDSVCPFTFEMPVYSHIENDKNDRAEPCWLNLVYPRFQSTLHLSYKIINGNLEGILNNTYELASKHQVKASGIETQVIAKKNSHVYGLIYDIEGNAASPFQFFLTDSTHNYIRGALYFNARPNTDSIAPVLDFIKQDIYRFIETFEWKDVAAAAKSKQ